MAKIKLYDKEFVNEGELEIGMELVIMDEANPEPKFRDQTCCTVKLPNGEEKILSINRTSLKGITKAWGDESLDWVEKILVYKGKVEMGNMTGKLFEPKE